MNKLESILYNAFKSIMMTMRMLKFMVSFYNIFSLKSSVVLKSFI